MIGTELTVASSEIYYSPKNLNIEINIIFISKYRS